MTYDVVAWRQRPDSPLSKALVYSLICEEVEIRQLEDLDLTEIERDLDFEFPDWRRDGAPFSCELYQTYLSFEFFHSKVPMHLPRVVAFAEAHGLTVFDPHG